MQVTETQTATLKFNLCKANFQNKEDAMLVAAGFTNHLSLSNIVLLERVLLQLSSWALEGGRAWPPQDFEIFSKKRFSS